MCSQQQSNALVTPFGLKVPNPANPFAHYHPSMTQAAFDFHRAQLYDYNARLHYGIRGYPGSAALTAYHPHPHDALAHFYQSKYDPRACTRFVHEEPKPAHSYIGLIGMAILQAKDMKLVLSDIYQHILDNYAYFRSRGPGWRNSIRHNLSLNDCFIKSGRSANGKGHYWAVHPANVEDFKKGDFRRRKAQRKVRRHMGLSVPDDEDSPSPPPPASTDSSEWAAKVLGREDGRGSPGLEGRRADGRPHSVDPAGPRSPSASTGSEAGAPKPLPAPPSTGKKRLFDVESLLAPDTNDTHHHFELHIHPSKMPKTIIITPGRLGPSTTDSLCDEVNPKPKDGLKIEEVTDDIDVEDLGEGSECNIESPTPCSPPRPSSSRPPSPAGSSMSETAPPSLTAANPVTARLCSPAHMAVSRLNSSPPQRALSPSGSSVIEAGPPSAAINSPSSPPMLPGKSVWTSPMVAGSGVGMGVAWREHHPSAFHSTGPTATPTTMTAWSSLPPHGYPIMSAPFPMPAPGTSTAEALAAQQRWQETFSRIMARSYEKNVKLEV